MNNVVDFLRSVTKRKETAGFKFSFQFKKRTFWDWLFSRPETYHLTVTQVKHPSQPSTNKEES